MEISRKKITDTEIHASETKLAADVNGIVAEFAGKFDALGYMLETEFLRDNENLEGEELDTLKSTDILEACEYSFGYSSGVKITVKKKVVASEEAEPAEEVPYTQGLTEEEAELIENEYAMEETQKEIARDVAFTSMYFVHIYKAFWRESVSISEGAEEVRADLEEFITVLAEKAGATEEEED